MDEKLMAVGFMVARTVHIGASLLVLSTGSSIAWSVVLPGAIGSEFCFGCCGRRVGGVAVGNPLVHFRCRIDEWAFAG